MGRFSIYSADTVAQRGSGCWATRSRGSINSNASVPAATFTQHRLFYRQSSHSRPCSGRSTANSFPRTSSRRSSYPGSRHGGGWLGQTSCSAGVADVFQVGLRVGPGVPRPILPRQRHRAPHSRPVAVISADSPARASAGSATRRTAGHPSSARGAPIAPAYSSSRLPARSFQSFRASRASRAGASGGAGR